MAGAPGHNKPRLSPAAILGLLMLLALAIRVAAVLARPLIEMDETSYVRMAQNLAAGNGPLEITGLNATNFSPLLPLLIAGMASITRDYVAAAYIVSAVFGSLLLLPVYLLGGELSGKRVGLMAAALVAVMPIYVDYSSQIYSENVYFFFLLLSIVFARHMLRGCRVPCSTLAGASLGLAYLANPAAGFYLAAFLAIALVVALRRGILPQMTRAVLILMASFCVYAVPYVIFLHAELGRWTFNGQSTGNSYAAARGLRHNTVEWEREMLALTGAGDSIRLYCLDDAADPVDNLVANPGQGLRILGRQVEYFYLNGVGRVMPLWLLPLMGLGLFGVAWTRSRAAAVGYLLVMMLPAFLVLTVYNSYTRLFMPFVALALIWVAQGWERLEHWGAASLATIAGEPTAGRWLSRIPWVAGGLVMAPLMLLAAITVTGHEYPVGYREAGESLAAVASPETKLMSRETAAAWYAGSKLVILPDADYEQMTAYARRQEVDYLVISRRDISERRPGLTVLEQEQSGHPDWKQIGMVREGTDEETMVFELLR